MKSCVLLLIMLATKSVATTLPTPEYEQFVQSLMERFKVPGLAIGITDSEGLLYAKGFGVKSIDSGGAVTADTQFAIGSVTKSFTAATAAILVDQGLLQWDLSIRDNYLPSFVLADPVATDLATMRDLLTHRVGLPRHDMVWYGTPFSRAELMEKLQFLAPSATFREKTQYNNLMFVAAGFVVEHLSSPDTWEEFTATRLLQPLGMTNTTSSVSEMQQSADYAFPHETVNGEATQISFRQLDAAAPAGALNASITDMGRWLRFHLNSGAIANQQLISTESMAELHTPHVVSTMMGFEHFFSEFGTEHYSLGWFQQTYRGEVLLHHGGGIDGFITFAGFMPHHNLAIVVVANSGSSLAPYAAALGYLDLTLSGVIAPWGERMQALDTPTTPEPYVPTPAPLALTAYVGSYFHPAYGNVHISLQDGTLTLTHYVHEGAIGHHDNNLFFPLHEGMLYGDTLSVQFELDAQGNVEALAMPLEPSVSAIRFVREHMQTELGTIEVRAAATWLRRPLSL